MLCIRWQGASLGALCLLLLLMLLPLPILLAQGDLALQGRQLLLQVQGQGRQGRRQAGPVLCMLLALCGGLALEPCCLPSRPLSHHMHQCSAAGVGAHAIRAGRRPRAAVARRGCLAVVAVLHGQPARAQLAHCRPVLGVGAWLGVPAPQRATCPHHQGKACGHAAEHVVVIPMRQPRSCTQTPGRPCSRAALQSKLPAGPCRWRGLVAREGPALLSSCRLGARRALTQNDSC